MSKMLVVVFDDETKAYEGSRALAELHREGSISAYSGAIVAREKDGRVFVMDDVDEGPIGTALGMMTGGLIGVFGGPPGVAVGAALGTLVGASADLINLGVGVDFVDEVGAHLEPGKVAVVSEVEEYWTTPVDTRMEELGGTVIRRYRIDVEDAQIDRDIAATKADYQELKAELKAAHQDNKAKLQAKLDASKAKLDASRDRAKAKLDSLKEESAAKIKAIQDQIATAQVETKEKLEKRKAELKSDYDERTGKLKKSWELTQEAFAA